MNLSLRAVGSAVLSVAMLAVTFVPLVTPMAAEAAVTQAVVTIDTINGAAPSGHCVAGTVTIVGHGTTGGSGGPYYLDIGWGDGSGTTTISDSSSSLTSGTLTGSTKSFTFTVSHTPVAASTGITIFLHHSTASGADSNVTVLNQCVAPPTQGVVTVYKQVSGGSKTASQFTLHIGSNSFSGSTSGTDNLLTAGNYTVTEDAATDYVGTYTGDCDANGNITVVAGNNYSCTLTNTYSPTTGTLTVIKHVSNTFGGTATASDWQLHVKSATSSSEVTNSPQAGSEMGTVYTLSGGTYNVSETGGPSGYTADLSACGSNGAVTVTNGSSTTCTITNSDVAPLLTLVKNVVNAFRGVQLPNAWTLSATGSSTISGATGSSAVTGAKVIAGTYTLSEAGPSGYLPSGWTCINSNTGTTTGSTFSLGVGDQTTCSITNSDIATSSLAITINVSNSNGTGSSQPSDFTATITGGDPSPASFTGSTTAQTSILDGDASYSVAVTGPTSGYSESLTSGCSGTTVPGAAASCTITLQDLPPTTGALTVIKQVVNDNGGTSVVSDFPLTVTASTSVQTTVTSGQSNQFLGGTYTVSETYDSTKYKQTFSGACNNSGQVTVVNGQSAVCTITNDDIAPSITLTAVPNNTHGGTAVASDWTVAAIGATSTVSGSGTASSDSTLQAGTYTLSESANPTGYTSGNWSCTGGSLSGNTLTVGIGESASCTITNSDEPASLTVIKHVINDNGGTAVAGDFTMNVTGTNVSTPSFPGDETGTTVTLDAGSYSVSESGGPAGYGETLGSDCSGSITVGESKTCTITNDDGKATLTIVKQTTGADGTFTFSVTGQSDQTITTTGGVGTSTLAVDAGNYDVLENNIPSGWSLSGAICVDGSGNGVGSEEYTGGNLVGATLTLNTGDAVTCTFENVADGADLSMSKSVDKSAPSVGDTVTYTLSVANAGPAAATGITVNDFLPSGLTYASDDGAGAYSTSTGLWSIASLAAGATTTLHLTATVNSGTQGQAITNSATVAIATTSAVTDFNSANNTGSATLTVNNPSSPTPTNTGGGGGGGGGIVISGPLSPGYTVTGPGEVLGAQTEATSCDKYLNAYIRMGKQNDSAEVTKLQTFLNNFEHAGLVITGTYDEPSLSAVNAFQTKYASDVLTPWGATGPTGYVYYTTQKKINEIYCSFTRQFPLSSDQLAEIARIKALGISYEPTTGTTPAVQGTTTITPTGSVETAPQGTTSEEGVVGASQDNSAQSASVGNTPAGQGSWWSRFLNWLFRR